MYFCPCSCDDPIDPETDDNTLFSLPRNLSYDQDSYLDRYSVSARFVHNPKIDRCIQHQQGQEWRANVEDETLGLLSAITAQELHGKCDVDFESVNSSGFVFTRPDSSIRSAFSKPPTGPTSTWSPGQSSSFSAATSLLHPASIVASKISAFLHSPPNESMDSARDIGTSVDGDTLLITTPSEIISKMDPTVFECPDSSGDEIDSNGRVKFYTSSHSEDSDVGDGDTAVAGADNKTDCCDNPDCFHEMASDIVVVNPIERDNNTHISQLDTIPHITGDGADIIYLSSSLELDDDSTGNPYGVGNTIAFSETDISNDGDTTDDILDISDVGYSYKFAKYPLLKPLDVEHKTYESKDGTTPDIERDGCEKSMRGPVDNTTYGSPDSDPFIEEGVFVNIDDLDSTNDKSTTVSDASDDTCVSVDSMFLSPEEGELEEDLNAQEPVQKMSLEEAITRAASDLTKISLEMYGPGREPATSNTGSSCSLLDIDDEIRFSSLTWKTAGRSSPVRGASGLKIKITDQNNIETQNPLTDSSTTLTDSPIYTEDEFNFSRVQLRKSSSLKSNKTPPGTPHRKKVVRFADAMGLDLESVRHVLNMESPPKIPASALADLMKGIDEENKELGSRYLCPCFSQPGASDNFAQKVRTQKVSLENAIINDLTITGFVRVANIAYHKSVRIRYTHNSWCSFYDIAASYVQGSCDGPTDRFSFTIVAPPYFGPGSRLEFAVCFIAEGTEYWDSNDGHNYIVECFAKTIPTDSELAWLHFL